MGMKTMRMRGGGGVYMTNDLIIPVHFYDDKRKGECLTTVCDCEIEMSVYRFSFYI